MRANGLTLAFMALFAASLVGHALVGHADLNHRAVAHGDETMSLVRFVGSSAFWVDVMENWQSEYLQFALFVLGTIWLVQRGSPESKQPGEAGRESDEQQLVGAHARPDSPAWAKAGGWRARLYGDSLLLVMTAIWVLSWSASLVTGRVEYNATQLDHRLEPLTLLQYAGSADFWNRTLQNWQSEFLAVGSMVVLSVYLRQRGSPQSKPVGAPHVETGAEG